MLSVTEGEDKPLKYPGMFNSADVAVITKMDLAVPCEFDIEAARRNILEVRPEMRIFETSAKTGAGFREWLEFLASARAHRRTLVEAIPQVRSETELAGIWHWHEV